jgi:iron complex outermembrane receptor protein
MYKTRTYRNFWYSGAATTGAEVIDFSNIEPHIRPNKRTVTYWYAQDEWNLARDWTLTAGVRHDKYSDFGGTTNPRVALVWEAAYDVTAKLLYGRAFRAPSFNELYGINPVANGTASLQPEKVATGEAAVSWQARKDLQLNASLFRYDAKDLIRLVSTRYVNTGRQHGTGGELEAVWDAGRNLRVTVNYSQQKSIDEATDRDPGLAPRQHWYARADWLWTAGWMASVQLNEVADRARASGDTRPAVGDYNTVDFTLRTSGDWRKWNFAVSIRNLFDTKAYEPTDTSVPGDLPLPRRSFYLQASYRI